MTTQSTNTAPKSDSAAATSPAKAPKKVFVAAIVSTYAGASKTHTKRAKRITLVGRPFTNFTYRTDSTLRDMLKKYAGKSFSDIGVDKAVREYLKFAGFLTAPESGKLQVTTDGLKFAKNCAALASGQSMPATSLKEYVERK